MDVGSRNKGWQSLDGGVWFMVMGVVWGFVPGERVVSGWELGLRFQGEGVV